MGLRAGMVVMGKRKVPAFAGDRTPLSDPSFITRNEESSVVGFCEH